MPDKANNNQQDKTPNHGLNPMPIDDLIHWLHTEQEVFMFGAGTKTLLIEALALYQKTTQNK